MTVMGDEALGLSVEVHRDPDGFRVVARGELDIATGPLLEAALEQLVSENGHLTVLLDMSVVRFVDCAGWRAVDTAAAALARRGGRLIVADASSPVRRFVQLTGDLELDIGSDGAGV